MTGADCMTTTSGWSASMTAFLGEGGDGTDQQYGQKPCELFHTLTFSLL
jgi:hypothetical protein